MINRSMLKLGLAAPFAAALVVAAPAAAEEDATGFDIEGNIRVRYEAMDGNFRPGGVESDDAVLLRSLVSASYTGTGFRVGATLQDSRAYANDASTPLGNADINALELIELYARLDLAENVSVTAGRQTVNLGSKRLLGNPGYRNAANAFTGARVDFADLGGGSLTAFYMLPQQRLPSSKSDILDNAVEWDHEGDDQVFWGAFYKRPDLGPLTLEAYVYVLDESDTATVATRDRQLVTPSLRLYSAQARGRFDGEVEAMYQTGSISASRAASAAELDVEAFSAHAELGYTFDHALKPRVAVLYDFASGDDPSSASYNNFDPLFGPRYSDWGPSGLFGPLSRNNIVSLGALVASKISARVDAQLQYRRNWLEEATDSFAKTGVRDATGAAGTDAGSQLQGRLRWWVIPGLLRHEVGGGVLFKGSFFDAAPNDTGFGNTHYGYSALEVSF